MGQVIIVKGHEDVLRASQAKADELYGSLVKYFTGRGHTVQVLDPHLLETIEDATYVVGHSRGTNVILDRLREIMPESLQGLALFDPSEDYREFWNSLKMPKVAFISRILNRPYAEGFDHSVYLKCDHYFTNSFPQIEDKLNHLFSLDF